MLALIIIIITRVVVVVAVVMLTEQSLCRTRLPLGRHVTRDMIAHALLLVVDIFGCRRRDLFPGPNESK